MKHPAEIRSIGTSREIEWRIDIRLVPAVIFCAALFFGFSGPVGARAASEKDGVLTVGAIQFALSAETYASVDSFRAALNKVLDKMETEAAEENSFPDLVVFPEYTSAFLGLSVLSNEEIKQIAENPALNRMKISEAIAATHHDMIDTWKFISNERPYVILAGSHLSIDSEGNLHNRAQAFKNGEIIWTQEKVFAGAPEKRILNLKTGQMTDARPIKVDGFVVYTTICRDTYHDEWEEVLPVADLWIDIKANELPYTQEYYDQALKARLPDSPIDRGLTVSLSGELLGFRFTGPTEYLYDEGPIAGTDPYAENEVLIIKIPVRTQR